MRNLSSVAMLHFGHLATLAALQQDWVLRTLFYARFAVVGWVNEDAVKGALVFQREVRRLVEVVAYETIEQLKAAVILEEAGAAWYWIIARRLCCQLGHQEENLITSKFRSCKKTLGAETTAMHEFVVMPLSSWRARYWAVASVN